MNWSMLAFPVLHHLPEFAQTHVHWANNLSNHLILCYPLLLFPSMFPSIRVFSSESVLHITWPRYWSINFSISPSTEYSGLISFGIDQFDLVVEGILKNLYQHHNSKASIPWCSAFFVVQHSHLYMTTGKPCCCCSVIHPSSFCPQSFPATGTFPVSQLFTSDDQNAGVSTSASVFPLSIQGWFPFRLTGLISLVSKGLSGAFSSTIVQRHQFFSPPPSLWSSSHNHTWSLGRPLTWLYGPLSAE